MIARVPFAGALHAAGDRRVERGDDASWPQPFATTAETGSGGGEVDEGLDLGAVDRTRFCRARCPARPAGAAGWRTPARPASATSLAAARRWAPRAVSAFTAASLTSIDREGVAGVEQPAAMRPPMRPSPMKPICMFSPRFGCLSSPWARRPAARRRRAPASRGDTASAPAGRGPGMMWASSWRKPANVSAGLPDSRRRRPAPGRGGCARGWRRGAWRPRPARHQPRCVFTRITCSPLVWPPSLCRVIPGASSLSPSWNCTRPSNTLRTMAGDVLRPRRESA